MGALSDRIGRKGPMIAGLALLAAATLAFAYAESLAMLFAARLLQGAADGMTWIVGFALIADLYGPDERGRAMGLAMAGSSLGIIIGPVLGGWLYEMGGIRLPFLFVAAMAIADLVVFALIAPRTHGSGASAPMRRVLASRPIAICALVVIAGGGTIAMLEPVIPLVFQARLGLGPGAIGTLFGIAAVASTMMHPIYGRLSDRFGGRRLMMIGLVGIGADASTSQPGDRLPLGGVRHGADVDGVQHDRHAVARIHGRSGVGGGPRILRRRVRRVQHGVGDRLDGVARPRRISARARRLRGADGRPGDFCCSSSASSSRRIRSA